MSYWTLHKSNVRFELTVTLLLVGTALTTMVMMFVHPAIAIFIFWFGMILAAGSAIVEAFVRRQERAEVRKAMAAHVCPKCGSDVSVNSAESSTWRCEECGTEISFDGQVLTVED